VTPLWRVTLCPRKGWQPAFLEALYCAAAVRASGDATLWSLRQGEQRAKHLRSLEQLIARCRFGEEDIWSEYAEFVRA